MLLIAGSSDPVEAWQAQLDGLSDRYRLTAFDTAAPAMVRTWRWTADAAPSPRAAPEAFFLWSDTSRAHEDGTVAQIVDEALAFPHPQSPEGFHAQLAAWSAHDTLDRLGEIRASTLVIAGGRDLATPPRLGRAVAERIPGAEFVLLPDEAHQPFQERPEEFDALVDSFWGRSFWSRLA